jgi:hypothetical protein
LEELQPAVGEGAVVQDPLAACGDLAPEWIHDHATESRDERTNDRSDQRDDDPIGLVREEVDHGCTLHEVVVGGDAVVPGRP